LEDGSPADPGRDFMRKGSFFRNFESIDAASTRQRGGREGIGVRE